MEKMAAQGWILTDMTLGMVYHFKKAEPCEKVFEVERFAVSAHADVQELSARKMAIDVASQSGWEIVTHDEDMNYYFMKDKAGDETDEFYDDEFRQARGERYRKHYSCENPVMLLSGWIIISIIYMVLFALPIFNFGEQSVFVWFYIILSVLEMVCCLLSIMQGQRIYSELSLSREEWENRKRNSVKRKFKKVQQLRAFLQEQSESGLAFTGYEDGKYLFEEDSQRYHYFVDTKACLKKRLKERGVRYKDDSKDWSAQGLEWYEMSIEDARQHGLKPVGL